MNRIFLVVVFVLLFPSHCLSNQKTFTHNNRKIVIDYIKRGSFSHHMIRIHGTIKGGSTCKAGVANVQIAGFGTFTNKKIPIKNYKTKAIFKTNVQASKKQKYGKVYIYSASFDCYR